MDEGKKLLEALHKATHDLRELAGSKGKSIEEVRASIAKANTDIDAIKTEIAKNIRPRIPAAGEGKTPSVEMRAFLRYARGGAGEESIWPVEERKALIERRGLAGTSDIDGGFLVPDEYSNQILMNAYDVSELMEYTNRGTTGRDRVVTPSLSKPVVAWGTQGLAVTDQVLSTGAVSIPIEFLQALSLISEDTLGDSQADLESQLLNAFSMAISEARDDAILVGTGATQPLGVLTKPGIQARYVPSGIAALLVDATHNGFDVLIQAYMKLIKKYRRNATWAMNSNTERVLRTSKDANGDFLWNPRGSLGEMDTLWGRPVATVEAAPDIAANSFPIVVGDFGNYWVRERTGIVIQRLVERYAEFGQVGFRIKHRLGGAPMLDEAFVPVKISVL